MKKLLIVIALSSSALAHAMPTVGDTVSGSISESTRAGNVVIPLPAGIWTVAYAGQFEGPRMQRANIDITGYSGEASNRFENLVLVQTSGGILKSILEIKYNLTNDLKTYADNICSNKSVYFRDDYSLKLWKQRCLEVNAISNPIPSDQTSKEQAIRSYLNGKNISLQSVFVTMNYGQYDRDGSRVEVKLSENPAAFNLNDKLEGGALSQWNKEAISKSPKKEEFMNNFINFSEIYTEEIYKKFR